eukprot:2600380-Amphidinium_carterae.1
MKRRDSSQTCEASDSVKNSTKPGKPPVLHHHDHGQSDDPYPDSSPGAYQNGARSHACAGKHPKSPPQNRQSGQNRACITFVCHVEAFDAQHALGQHCLTMPVVQFWTSYMMSKVLQLIQLEAISQSITLTKSQRFGKSPHTTLVQLLMCVCELVSTLSITSPTLRSRERNKTQSPTAATVLATALAFEGFQSAGW